MTHESATASLTPPVSQRDHQQGPATAPVTLVEYGDYECPYCWEAYPIVKEIQRRLGDRMRFVFRNFPLVFGSGSHTHLAEPKVTTWEKQLKKWQCKKVTTYSP